jgi:hypothetical protein
VFGDCTTQPNHMITTINPASTISTCDEHYPPSLGPGGGSFGRLGRALKWLDPITWRDQSLVTPW